MKKLVVLICALALLLSMASSAIAAPAAAGTSATGLNFVIVVDESGSMAKSDPTDIAVRSINALVNRCPADGFNSVAVIAYNANIIFNTKDYYPDGFAKLDTETDKSNLITDVRDNLPTSKNQMNNKWNKIGDTNTGRALEEAYNLIKNHQMSHPSDKYVVMLFTDGMIYMGDEAYGKGGHKDPEATSDSENTAETNKKNLQAAGVPLYIIGLSADSNKREETRQAFEMKLKPWANDTKGRFENPNSIEEAEKAIGKFYAEITGADREAVKLDNEGKGSFEVKENTQQLTVEFAVGDGEKISGNKWENVTLTDPNGNVYKLSDKSGTDWSMTEISDTSCSVLIKKPAEGTWHVQVPSKDWSWKVEAYTIGSLNMVLNVDHTDRIYEKGENCTFTLLVTKQGQPYNAEDAYLMIDGTEHKMNNTGADGKYNCMMPLALDVGRHTITAEIITDRGIPGKEFTNESYPLDVLITGVTPSFKKTLPTEFDPYLYTGHTLNCTETPIPYEPKEYNLSNALEDSDGVGINNYYVTLEETSGFLEDNDHGCTIEGDWLAFDPKAAVAKYIDSGYGKKNQYNFIITVTAAANSGKPVNGELKLEIKIEDADEPVQLTERGQKVDTDFSLKNYPEWLCELPVIGDLFDKPWAMENVRDCFEEPNTKCGDRILNVAASTDKDEIVEVDYDGASDVLRLNPLKEGKAEIVITALSSDGSKEDITLKVTSVDMMKRVMIICGGILLVIVLLIVIILTRKANNRAAFSRESLLQITIENDGSEEEGATELHRYHKKAVTVTDLLRRAGVTNDHLKETDKMIVKPRRNGILVVNNSGKKKQEHALNDGDSCEFTFRNDDTISFDYSVTYSDD